MLTKIEKIVRMIRELSIIEKLLDVIDVTQRQWRIGSAVLAVQSSKKSWGLEEKIWNNAHM